MSWSGRAGVGGLRGDGVRGDNGEGDGLSSCTIRPTTQWSEVYPEPRVMEPADVCKVPLAHEVLQPGVLLKRSSAVCDARRAGIWRRDLRMLVSVESGLLASDGICADLVAVDLGALRRVE